MYIDEYISKHPELLPEGEDLIKFSTKCENWIPDCRDLIPWEDPNYVEEVFNLCIEMQLKYEKRNKIY